MATHVACLGHVAVVLVTGRDKFCDVFPKIIFVFQFIFHLSQKIWLCIPYGEYSVSVQSFTTTRFMLGTQFQKLLSYSVRKHCLLWRPHSSSRVDVDVQNRLRAQVMVSHFCYRMKLGGILLIPLPTTGQVKNFASSERILQVL